MSILSSADALLTTALRLTQQGQAVFSVETLIVEAWKDHPAKFGMKDHSYPDSHRAMSYLCGAKGLVSREFLHRSPAGHSLTDRGRRQAVRLIGQDIPSPAKPEVKAKRRLPAAQDRLLMRLLAVAGRKRPAKEWTFTEACFWWGVTEDGTKVESISAELGDALDVLAGERCVLSNGREVTADEAIELFDTNDALCERFKSHLKLLATRNGKAHA
jgi:hypothetical protein